MKKVFQFPSFFPERLRQIKITLFDRLEDDRTIKYCSYCYGSESILFWRWEINIQNRRKKL